MWTTRKEEMNVALHGKIITEENKTNHRMPAKQWTQWDTNKLPSQLHKHYFIPNKSWKTKIKRVLRTLKSSIQNRRDFAGRTKPKKKYKNKLIDELGAHQWTTLTEKMNQHTPINEWHINNSVLFKLHEINQEAANTELAEREEQIKRTRQVLQILMTTLINIWSFSIKYGYQKQKMVT